jgi:hypothetical protein
MAVSKNQIKCVHVFLATNRKSVLKVESISNNLRVKPKRMDVVATIFKCSKCGAQKEYPDSLERGFRIIPIEKAAPI